MKYHYDLKVGANKSMDVPKHVKIGNKPVEGSVLPLLGVEKLFQDKSWPIAVPKKMLCLNERDKMEKAHDILEWVIETPLVDKKFLDFGCGEGYILKEARQRKSSAFGYEINKSCVNNEDQIFDDWEKIKANGPYDIILMYDVIDHLRGLTIPEAMQMVKGVCHKDTKVYVTVHPFFSRHGAHHHPAVNKAFSHLFKNEIKPNWFKSFGFYQGRFAGAGFQTVNYVLRSDKVEMFFLNNPVVRQHLVKIAKAIGCDLTGLIWRMRNSFFDFTLQLGNAVKRPHPVALIRHILGGGDSFYHTLYSNNKISDINSPDEWYVRDNHFSLRWPRADAPGGVWLDECFLDEDLQSYSGTNQNGLQINGELI